MPKGYLIYGNNNFIGAGSDRIALIECRDCIVHPAASGITLIACSGLNTDPTYNNTVWIKNQRYFETGEHIATASSPSTVDGTFKFCHVDASGGDVDIDFGDPAILKNCEIIFIRIDNTANNVNFNAFGTELLDFMALPQILIPSQADTVRIHSDGTNWFTI